MSQAAQVHRSAIEDRLINFGADVALKFAVDAGVPVSEAKAIIANA
jgi:hypothetical protein